MKILTTFVIAALTGVPSAIAQQEGPPKLQSFEFIGCSGDFERLDSTPEVWRVMRDGKVSFLTHTVAACGLSGRSPVVTGNLATLNLGYEMYSPTDVAIMCECEYWAKFTFGPEAHTVKTVTFNGEPTVLKGSWPGR